MDDNYRLRLFIGLSMIESRNKQLVHYHIIKSSPLCYKRFAGKWKLFVKILLFTSSSPVPVHLDTLNKMIGYKSSIPIYMMLANGWLNTSGWPKHFVVSKKGIELIEAIIKELEQDYSTFYHNQYELKKTKMGDLWEEPKERFIKKRKRSS